MLTAEQIKKLIEIAKPEGFSYDNIPDCIYYMFQLPNGERWAILPDMDFTTIHNWKDVYSPLFLQKCIEGVNRGNPEYLQIAQCGYSIQVLTDCNREVLLNINLTERNGVSIDQAKEQALIYILENI